MSSDLIHPDTGVIKTIARAGSYLILLPRVDRQGMKQIPLPVPIALADKLAAGTSGGVTHAIAVLARWVLEDLIKPDMQLIALPKVAAFDFVLQPRKNSRYAVQVDGQLDPKGTRPILVSLPPVLHEKLRELSSGSIRQTLLALLQYGLEQLDITQKTLELTKPEPASDEGKPVILLVDGSGECEDWIKEALPVMQWLGYLVKIAQKQDLQQAFPINCVGILIVSQTNENVPDELKNQTEVQMLHYEVQQDAAGAFCSPEGMLSRKERPVFMSAARTAYCVQCDRGVSVIEESESRRDANKMYERVYCRACRSLFGLDR